MPAYIVAQLTVHDLDTYRKYTAKTPAIVERHGGRFLTRGEDITVLEGTSDVGRMVLLEFPDAAAVHAFYNDPDYQAAMKYRLAASTGTFLVQEHPHP